MGGCLTREVVAEGPHWAQRPVVVVVLMPGWETLFLFLHSSSEDVFTQSWSGPEGERHALNFKRGRGLGKKVVAECVAVCVEIESVGGLQHVRRQW